MRELPTYANAEKQVPSDYMFLQVLLDGVPQQHVIEVNVAEGWAVIISQDPDGRFMVLEGEERRLATERVEGAWTVRWQEGYDDTTA